MKDNKNLDKKFDKLFGYFLLNPPAYKAYARAIPIKSKNEKTLNEHIKQFIKQNYISKQELKDKLEKMKISVKDLKHFKCTKCKKEFKIKICDKY